MNQQLEIVRVESSSGADFEGLLRIYAEALPPGERKSPEQIRRLFESPNYSFMVARLGDRVAGFTVLVSYSSSDGALLEYLAVEKSERRRGIGRRLLEDACRQIDARSRFMLVEVDSDHDPGQDPGPGRNQRARRKQFYRASGCREIEGLRYIMPPVAAERPPAMDLLIYAKTLPAAIGRQQLRNWLSSTYAEVYGQSPEDPRIEKMVAALPGEIKLIQE